MKGCLKFPSLSPTPTPGLDGRPSTSFSFSTGADDALGSSGAGASFPFYANSNASTSSTSSATSQCTHRKCVAFGAEGSLEEVYTADEWDRTPTEPARKLTYQDLLELKEIQRSLPRANQPCDLISGRPSRHYLSAVPIGLLPLLAENDSSDAGEYSSSMGSSQTSSGAASPGDVSPTRGHNSSTSYSSSYSHWHAQSQTQTYSSSPLSTTATASASSSSPASPYTINFHRQKPYPPRAPPPSPAVLSPTPSTPSSPSPSSASFPFPSSAPSTPTSASTPTSSTPRAPFAHRPYSSPANAGTGVRIGEEAYRTPAHLKHLFPAKTPGQRVKPGFAFLALLDTPPDTPPAAEAGAGGVGVGVIREEEEGVRDDVDVDADDSEHDLLSLASISSDTDHDIDHDTDTDTDHDHDHDHDHHDSSSLDPPTPSLTNASLDSSPHSSRASSCSPERLGAGFGAGFGALSRRNVVAGASTTTVAPGYVNFKRSPAAAVGGNGGVASYFPLQHGLSNEETIRGRQPAYGYGGGYGGGGYGYGYKGPGTGLFPHLPPLKGQVNLRSRGEVVSVGPGGLKNQGPAAAEKEKKTGAGRGVMPVHAAELGLGPPSPLCLDVGAGVELLGGCDGMVNAVEKKEKKKRNFIVVNDVEIYLDDEEEEEEEEDTALSETQPLTSHSMSISMMNGIPPPGAEIDMAKSAFSIADVLASTASASAYSSTSTLSSSTSTPTSTSTSISTSTSTTLSTSISASSQNETTPTIPHTDTLSSTSTSTTSTSTSTSTTNNTLNTNVNLHLPIRFKRTLSSTV